MILKKKTKLLEGRWLASVFAKKLPPDFQNPALPSLLPSTSHALGFGTTPPRCGLPRSLCPAMSSSGRGQGWKRRLLPNDEFFGTPGFTWGWSRCGVGAKDGLLTQHVPKKQKLSLGNVLKPRSSPGSLLFQKLAMNQSKCSCFKTGLTVHR